MEEQMVSISKNELENYVRDQQRLEMLTEYFQRHDVCVNPVVYILLGIQIP